MARNMNLLTVFLHVVVLAACVEFSSATCQSEVTCPCGTSGQNITFCSKHLSEGEDICQQLVRCKRCHPGVDHCTECPSGLTGPTCSQETSNELLVRLKREFRYARSGSFSRKRVRHSSGGSETCPNLKNTGLIALRCTDDGTIRTCRGKCITGHVFKGREGEREIEMTCEQGRWSPTGAFPVCVSSGLCELSLTGDGPGSYNCTTEMNGKKCDVVCDGRNRGRFFCYPGREWEPRLPHCVQAKGDQVVISADRSRQCRCQNGGTCDAYGRCECPVGWAGTKCEKSNRHCKLVLTGHSNGSYDCTTEMNGTVCEVQCDGTKRGYFYCYPDRDWEPRLPHCVKVKEGATAVDANRIRCQCRNGGYCDVDGRCICPAGRSGTKCEKGATVIDDNLTRCQCQNGGICDHDGRCACPEGWSGANCERASCADPGLLANADSVNMFGTSTSSKANYKPGEIVHFTCHQGFSLKGSAYITCQTSGIWTRKPTCVRLTRTATTTTPSPVTCPDPGFVQHADRMNINCPPGPILVYYPGYAVIYACYSGYVLEGTTFRTCLPSGRWSGEKPICHVFVPPSTTTARTTTTVDSDSGSSDCPDPGAIANGVRNSFPSLSEHQQGYLRGSRVTYYCNEGYNLQGVESIFCLVTGEWSSSKPACEQVPRSGDETVIDAFDVQCRCQNGGTCDSNGRCVCPPKWSGNNCEDEKPDLGGLYCLDPGNVENSERESFPPVSGRQRGYLQGTRMTYNCKEGYQLQGDRSMFCMITGTWSSSKPTCEPIPRPGGESAIDVYETQCQCQNGGDCDSIGRCVCPAGWTGTNCETAEPDRGSLYCPDPGAIANGERTSIPPLSARQRGFLQGSRVTYACKEGYHLIGDSSMFCLVSGEWSSTRPTCGPRSDAVKQQ